MEQLNFSLKKITIRQEQPPKKVTMNTKLMEDLLAYAPEFRFWKYRSFDQLFHLVKLNSSDAYSVVNSFNSTMTSPKGPSYSVQCVIRVENPFLLAQFHLKKIQSNDEERYASVTELFHGTHGKSVLPICRNNFNWRLTGRYYNYVYFWSPISCIQKIFGFIHSYLSVEVHISYMDHNRYQILNNCSNL